MPQMDNDRATLLRECQEAVDQLLAQRPWRLLNREEWARRAFEQSSAEPAAGPHRTAIHVYIQALHAACSGVEGPQRQNLGYTELFVSANKSWVKSPLTGAPVDAANSDPNPHSA